MISENVVSYRHRGDRVLMAFALGVLIVAAPRVAFADAAKGEQLYKRERCSMCHKISGSGGKKGPDLSAVGNARDAQWLSKYLVNTKSMIPKATMPPAKVTSGELKDLIEYLESLKSEK